MVSSEAKELGKRILELEKENASLKKLENELKRVKSYSQILFDRTPSAIFTVDKDKIVTSWNLKAAEVTGFTAEEIVGKECSIFALEPCKEDCGLYSEEVNKPILAKECTIICKDGRQKIISKNVDFLKSESGKIIGGVESFEDITYRKLDEEVLEENEKVMREWFSELNYIYGKIPVGLGWLDREFRFKRVNEHMATITGKKVFEHIGSTIREMTPELADNIYPMLKKVIKTGDPVIGEELRSKDPSEPKMHKYWLMNYYPVKFEDGTVRGVGIVFQDITKQKYAEEALEDNLHFLQQLIDAIPTPVFYKDAEGNYSGCNKAFENFLGLPRSAIIGKPLHDIIPKDLADEYYTIDRELLETPDNIVYEGESEFADGSRRDMIFHKATLTDPDGTIIGLVGVMLDITEHKKAEKLTLDKEKLKTVLEMAGATCHNLNQPLQVLSLSTSLLHDRVPDDFKHKDLIKNMKDAYLRIANITEKLGNITRYETTDYTDSTKIIDIDKASQKE
ncbi:PAS domain-containing protein [candidate division KSB1 bacterium]